jgi:hypothetical protein
MTGHALAAAQVDLTICLPLTSMAINLFLSHDQLAHPR